jgi:3-oxoacyl-[acyl-carrier protein] reductase
MRKALVTGAGQGIGKATAIALAKAGYSVAINYRSSDESAQTVLDECNKHSEGNILVKADVTSSSEINEMFQKLKGSFGTLDVLVNNAGIFSEKDSPTNLVVFDEIYKSNFLSCVAITKHALEMMETGSIINISSIHGRVGHGSPRAIAYSAFKAALDSYTKNLAKDVAPSVLVNGIAPGRVNTPMWGVENDLEKEELGQVHAIKRMIEPEEIADAVLFLINNKAMCGEVLTIDGGMSLITLG